MIARMTTNQPEVRAATTADADAIWHLARDLATSAVLDRAAFDRTHAHLVTDPGGVVLVAELPTLGVVGYLTARSWPTYRANGPVAWVDELMVAEPVRRSGAGRALLRHAEQWARDLGAPQVALATRRAGPFYRALGYDASAEYFKRYLTPDA